MARLLRREVAAARRLRLVRDGGLHPRPREPVHRRPSSSTPFTRARAPTTPTPVRPVARWHAPEGELHLPGSPAACCGPWPTSSPVDYSIPGCPPETDAHRRGRSASWSPPWTGQAELPPRGAVLGAGHSTVCDECPRERNVKRLGGIHAHPGPRRDRSDALPARAGPALQRAGDPRRLRRAVPGGGRAVHRLLRPDRGRRRPGRPPACPRSPRSSTRPSRTTSSAILDGHPRPGRPVLPLQPGPLAPAAGRRGRALAAPGDRTMTQRHHRSRHPPRGARQDRDPPRRARARSPAPTSRSPSCAASSASASADRSRRCRR